MRRGAKGRYLAIAVAAAAAGIGAGEVRAATFDGSCSAVGEGGFERPAGYLPGPNTWWLVAEGGCSGTLDGRPIANHPIRVRIRFDDPLAGCAASLTTGTGKLVFRGRRRRTIRFEQTQAGPGAVVRGHSTGTGLAYLTAYTQLARQYPDAPQRCAEATLERFVAEWAMKSAGPIAG